MICFLDSSETDLDLEVVLGDDTVVRAVGHGTVQFERESMQPNIREILRSKMGLI